MELDDDGYILHIMDDPSLTMLPVVNRFHHNGKDGMPLVDESGWALSFRGGRVLGRNPVNHPPELLPIELSDEDYDYLREEGLTGFKDTGKKLGAWHHRYERKTNKFIKEDVF